MYVEEYPARGGAGLGQWRAFESLFTQMFRSPETGTGALQLDLPS
jgi:hypothetical protein